MPGYKLIVKNAKVILKTVTNSVLNITGIKDLLTGTGSVDSNNKIDWTLQEYTNTAANFTTNNPILLLGQKGIETDDLLTAPKFKIGDGVTAWNTLPYANSGGSSSGVQSVTGPQVDDTDPNNPIINAPTLQEVTDEGATTTNVIEAAGVIADSFVTPLGFSTIYEDGAYFYQGDAATELLNIDNNTDLVTYKEKEIAVIEATQTTGVALTFLTDSVYGTIGTPETGNITYSATSAKLGVTNLIIHNHSVAPTFAANMKESSGSLGYSLSVINYIWVTYINSTEVLYRIEQRA